MERDLLGAHADRDEALGRWARLGHGDRGARDVDRDRLARRGHDLAGEQVDWPRKLATNAVRGSS